MTSSHADDAIALVPPHEAHASQPAPPMTRQLSTELFEDEGLAAVFQHARNVLTGSMMVAAGLYAARHPNLPAQPDVTAAPFAGYVVAGIGVVLLVLNLCDGLRRLARRRHSMLLRAAAIVVYVALTLRLAQVVVHFRGVV